MHHAPRSTLHAPRSARGFTMIEIALSMAIIAFALVAIIGVLPLGMQTQKDNRQETIINQDATVFLDAIRNGAQGLDDLTNYVVAITNYWTYYGPTPTRNGQNWYTYTGCSIPPSDPPLLLTNGLHIIGLLSTPKCVPLPPWKPGAKFTYMSNHVVAYVRSMSGPAAEKTPPGYTVGVNPVQDAAFNLGFSYRMVSDVVPCFKLTNTGAFFPGAPTGAPISDANYARCADNLQANLHDLRLTFLWPLLPNGSAGSGYQVFRASAAGTLIWTNEITQSASWPTPLTAGVLPTTLFFFQPRTYLQVQAP